MNIDTGDSADGLMAFVLVGMISQDQDKLYKNLVMNQFMYCSVWSPSGSEILSINMKQIFY